MGLVWHFTPSEGVLEDLLRREDEAREKYLLKKVDKPYRYKVIKDRFYRTVSQPFRLPCLGRERRIGGIWFDECAFHDGEKTVCFNDDLLEKARKGECLVYSFGLSDDVSWELAMADLGCKIRGFDPTVDIDEMNAAVAHNPNVTFYNLGLAHINGFAKIGELKIPIDTLENIFESFGESETEISYLKVDIEGYEVAAFSHWASPDGELRNVRQFGIELHLEELFDAFTPEMMTKFYVSLLKDFQRMYRKMGFKMIANNPNFCSGQAYDSEDKYHALFDIVFIRDDKSIKKKRLKE